MAPKYHPTPLSGGDRKALNKELGKSRAMANLLAAQSAEMRAKGEALTQQATSWNAVTSSEPAAMMMMKCSVPPNAPMALPGAVVTRERQYEPVSFKDTAQPVAHDPRSGRWFHDFPR